jgi:hypothetical protein
LYAVISSNDEKLLIGLFFLKKKKKKKKLKYQNGGWLKVEINILLYGDNSRTVALR